MGCTSNKKRGWQASYVVFQITLCLCLSFNSFGQSTPIAFPGAEGFGKYATGGRGGKIIRVTNLNDRGQGSLREALLASGPRIVVFEVSGNIELQSRISVRNGDLTIAGQTAPGDGITVKNYNLDFRGTNIIVRFMRFRLGDSANFQGNPGYGVYMDNTIFDHCSFSWGIDETASFYAVRNFTMQWCIISEGLNSSIHEKGDHGYLAITGGKNVSWHHNLLAHATQRMTMFDHSGLYDSEQEKIDWRGITDFRNNVIYNWSERASSNGADGKFNVVNNYYRPGPATSSESKAHFLNPQKTGSGSTFNYGRFYVTGNTLHGNSSVTGNNKLGTRLESSSLTEQLLGEVLVSSAFTIPNGLYDATHTASEAFDKVLEFAGANLFRDAVDTRVINETRAGSYTFKGSKTGLLGVIDSQKDVGGWPQLNSLPAPKDSDRDGMPDAWEIANGLDPNKADDSGKKLHTYFTNIEVYINSLVDPVIFKNSPEIVKVTGISVSPRETTLKSGESISVSATVAPNNATNKKVVWASDNPTAATVDQAGLVLGKAAGIAKITARTEDGNFVATSTVTVTQDNIPSIVSLTLVDSQTGSELIQLNNNLIIDIAQVRNKKVTILANTGLQEPTSVYLKLDGPVSTSTSDNTKPYSLFGDNGGTLEGKEFTVGKYKIESIPYSGTNQSGTAGNPIIFEFEIKELVPNPPALQSPVKGATNQKLDLTLQWKAVLNASTYRVQVSEKADFSTLFADESSISTLQFQISQLKENTLYYWRVSARNTVGNGNWSETWSFSTQKAIPAVPELLSPSNSQVSATGKITLRWTKTTNAEVYRIQVSRQQDFGVKQYDIYNLPSETIELTLVEPGTYYWRVNASNATGASNFSPSRHFEAINLPKTPILTSPQNNAQNQEKSLTLQWKNVEGADSYRLQVSTSRDFSQRLIDQGNVIEPIFQLSNLEEGQEYYWRVRAINRAGGSSYSEIWSFVTKSPITVPPVPQLVSPTSSSLVEFVNVNLKWKPSPTAERYRLQVSKFSNFSQSFIVNSDTLSASELTIPSLEPNQVYFWRVRSINSSGTSAYSSVWNFRTKPTPILEAPILLSPLNDKLKVGPAIEFTWSPVTGAKEYVLAIATNKNLSENLITINSLSESKFQIDSLKTGLTYYWNVRAIGEWSTSQSEVWSFKLLDNNISARQDITIHVYPNPFEESINLQFSQAIDGDVSFSIIDHSGQVLFEKIINDIDEVIPLAIPSHFPSGIYLVKIQGFGFLKTEKLIKR